MSGRIQVLVLAILVLAVGSTAADEEWVELLRADLRANKVAVLTEAMELSDAEGKRFWPIFRDYDRELSAIGDRRLELIRDYAESYDMLSDEKAGVLASEWFSIRQDLLKLRKKYYKRVEKQLSSSVAARFIQVEHQIGLIIDLELISELPLIHAVSE